MGNNITCSTNCKYRTAAKLYALETWFVPGIIVNTLHIGDDDDDDDDNNDNNNNKREHVVPHS
jgi:hypothetical protein